jgi:hypothetical protein
MVNSPNYFTTQENPINQSLSFSFITSDIMLFLITLSSLYGFVNFFFGRFIQAQNALFYETIKDLLVAFALTVLLGLWLFNLSFG